MSDETTTPQDRNRKVDPELSYMKALALLPEHMRGDFQSNCDALSATEDMLKRAESKPPMLAAIKKSATYRLYVNTKALLEAVRDVDTTKPDELKEAVDRFIENRPSQSQAMG